MHDLRRRSRSLVVATLMATSAPSVVSAQDLPVDLTGRQPAFSNSGLKAGGRGPTGETISVNNHYVSVDGRPKILLTGEFHYYRYPRAYWEEELLKMKAAGIDTVATYAHWNVHEEKEGVFDWSGDRDLRAFVTLCGSLGMKVILRVGPFGHGEVRNGGFPDWLMGRPLTVRTNDPEYLRYVARLYDKIGEQVRGQMFRDGGPIIGLQIENEYQHSASPWALNYPGQPLEWTTAPEDSGIIRHQLGTAVGENTRAEAGLAHMRRLKELATEAGLDVPLWTATGWGNATIIPGETLPVQAAYAYPSWEERPSPSSLYLYKDLQKTPDYAPLSYDATKYPYLAAELGPGMINNYGRRPHIPAESADALVNRFLGSGANGIGYYMFQSGTTPRGACSFLADEAFGYPHMSYDFGGPIGEFGELRPTYQRLKLLQLFTNAFGDVLAPTPVVLPVQEKDLAPTDVSQVRYAARGANGSGFVFVNNFQDHVATADREISFNVTTPSGSVRLPLTGKLHVAAGDNLVLPVNLDMAGVRLVSATVQPLTRFASEKGQHFVFFGHAGALRQFVFASSVIINDASPGCRVSRSRGLTTVECVPVDVARFRASGPQGAADVVLLDHKTALTAWLSGSGTSSRLLLSEAAPLQRETTTAFRSMGESEARLRVYPAPSREPSIVGPGRLTRLPAKSGFATYLLIQQKYIPRVKADWSAANKLSVALPPAKLPAGVSDVFMRLPYEADTAMAFVGGELVADHFYAGEPWLIGTKRFLGRDATMLFYFRPLKDKLPYYPDLPGGPPDISAGKSLIRVGAVSLVPEYETTIRF